jgi:DNA mismatch repair protein MutS2
MGPGSLELLEYASLKELVGRHISSAAARRLLDDLTPSTHREALEHALAEVAEAMRWLDEANSPGNAAKGSAVRFTGLPDVAEAAARLRIEGAGLDGRELHDLIQWLERSGDMRAAIFLVVDRYPLLAQRAQKLGDFRSVLREISGKVLPDGSLADDASVALHRLRRGMNKQKEHIQSSLEKFLRVHRDEGVLQDEYVTIRNDRFVVPLVAGQHKKVDGVIHAASGTGATLFVEPMETIQLNNELVRMTEEEMREVHRILRELTEALRAHAASIRDSIATMAILELTFAKANLGGVIPSFGDTLRLVEARHPILADVLRRERRRPVPVSFGLDPINRTLLITGPNTGGKTVTMKTAGLLALMAQSAMPVPAREAEFPIFQQILADIGDNQSIAESLSSFSSHIRHVSEMLEQATPDSLVLLDELGRATDPEEGGALGIAILEKFREYGALTMASTHLTALKIWGANTPGVIQASMGFDDATLKPTYLLQTGAPGRSAGLAIASQLGMPPALIERAKQAMTSTERDIAAFIAELHRRLEEVNREKADLEQKRTQFELETNQQREASKKAHEQKIREVERRSEAALAQFEAQAREAIEGAMAGLASKKAAENAIRKVARTRAELKDEVGALRGPVGGPAALPPIVEGSRVKLKGVRDIARVKRLLPSGEIEVVIGFMKMRVPVADVLEVLPAGGADPKLPSGVTFQQGPAYETVTRELNLIGKRADEAMDEVDAFLDRAAIASVDRVRIVHGHGMGILKRAVADLLKKSPHVSDFYPATPAEGGTGATIAELKG